MSCALCRSSHQAEFGAEVNIHLPGLMNADKPGIFVFPKLQVCLHCGFSRFTVPASELALLRRVAPITESSTRQDGRIAAHYPVGM
jgi:hypothetical protein